MEAFIIEQAGQIKEAFSYDLPLIDASLHALEEYALATYGDDAVLRPMTREEAADYARLGPEFFKKTPQREQAPDRVVRHIRNS